MLHYNLFEDTLLDTERFVNHIALSLLGKEFYRPVLMPNILLRGVLRQYLEDKIKTSNWHGDQFLIVTR